ncbi:uncharacterized protein HD556DRAFT_1245010 [Suillus plorans]|uniref:Protein kinase domain-containing protein n=1 Tax=Suillus plorans TaxID=116603 RepID=A0A9P7DDX0_9AGAM|nr:uncharacterized protein HD556DRAFT_1245010 [Suillus plorans]KAG1788551.1 hypothetical protein HD556DRAFT_1245010 [Suillus plorans]
MKRGFLNTRKAKQRVAEAVDAESTQAGEPPHKKSKGDDEKGERYVAITDDIAYCKTICCSLDPKSRSTRAEYVEFNTIDSHKLPKIIQQQVDNEKNCTGYGKNRVVFRVWPRDPKGQTITVTSLRAKEAANGIDLWGATLYDFYWVLRAPDVKNYLTISTGSRLAKWMRQHGELIAEDELYWADKEEDPKEVPVVDIGELIRCHDARVASGVFNKFSSIDSPFHPDHYPSPYPFVPFTHEAPKLQQRIPLHLLPKKLHVHDPWNTLTVDKDDSNQKPEWLSKVAKKGDIVRTYSLSLAPQSKEVASKAQKLAEVAEDEAAKKESVSHIFPSDKEGPTEEPLIEVVLPLRPRKRTQVEEAHLYLSPCAVGVGHHSIVRNAEWELPRDLFVEAHLCKACVEEDVRRQVQKLKDEGEWEALLKEQAEKSEETTQEYSEEEIFTLEPPRVIRIASYSGPVLRIHTTVKWRSPSEKQCDHESSFFGSEPVPRTATVSIVAKLSFEYDPHLTQEAANYQSFPDHFFQHWNGYNVIPPIHEPIPVGALCPQFYGYYTPDNPTGGKYRGRRRYLSPILLLEHCGSEIDPDKLCQDDRQECASLILRFNRAGWLHGSLATRNIMWQQGKPTEWPIERPHSVKSFRLIDFGRSAKVNNRTGLPMGEDEIALRLFYLMHHAHKKKTN